MSAKPLLLVVACALMDEGRVLLAQRPQGKPMAGLWELPGGKVEAFETPEQALVREIKEELAVVCQDFRPLTFASHNYETFHLLMPVYICTRFLGTPQGLEGQNLAWVAPSQHAQYPMPPADIGLFEAIENYQSTMPLKPKTLC